MIGRQMIQAGARPLSTIAYVSEVQRDWARPSAEEIAKLFAEQCNENDAALRTHGKRGQGACDLDQ